MYGYLLKPSRCDSQTAEDYAENVAPRRQEGTGDDRKHAWSKPRKEHCLTLIGAKVGSLESGRLGSCNCRGARHLGHYWVTAEREGAGNGSAMGSG